MAKAFKKIAVMVMVISMLICAFQLVGCREVSLEDYKDIKSQALEDYANIEDEENYSIDVWQKLCIVLADGKAAIMDATTKSEVTTAFNNAKRKIREVQINNTFPSVLEDFDIEEFTNEFFENNTLILVPFQWPNLLYERLIFYTVFAENGKLNFLLEHVDPYRLGDMVIDVRVFAVILPNAIFNSLEIGEVRIFETFETYDISGASSTEKSRELLSKAEMESVNHRVSYAYCNSTFSAWPVLSNPVKFKRSVSGITVITSMENLQEYFII